MADNNSADETVTGAPKSKNVSTGSSASQSSASAESSTDGSNAGDSGAESAATSTFAKMKAQASTLVDEAADAARSAASQGKDKAAEALGGLSKLAEDAAKAVDDRLGGNYGDYARRASTSVSDFATSLQGKDVDAIIADTKAFVRKSPVAAIGAAAAVGFLLTRLVKIGSSDRDA